MINRIMVYQRNRRIVVEWGFFGSFDAPWSEWSWIDLFTKETQNLFSGSFGFSNPILDYFLKETHLQWGLTWLWWMTVKNKTFWHNSHCFSRATQVQTQAIEMTQVKTKLDANTCTNKIIWSIFSGLTMEHSGILESVYAQGDLDPVFSSAKHNLVW